MHHNFTRRVEALTIGMAKEAKSMRSILQATLLMLSTSLLMGCNVRVSTSTTPPDARQKVATTNDKGVVTVTTGVDESKYQLTTLPSGKQIKLIVIMPVHFADGGSPPALWLKYRTDIPIDNLQELRTEAKAIWEDFRIEVEKSGFTGAIITAYEAPKGDTTSNGKSYNFTWEKDMQGEWSSGPRN